MILQLKRIDWTLFILLILLLTVGIFAIYSASTQKVGNDFFSEDFYLRQIVWIIISLVIMLAVLRLPLSLIDLAVVPSYIISLILLLLVLFLPEIKGSHRWIQFSPFNIQPSEIAKLSTLLVLAKVLAKPNLREDQILARAFAIALPPFLLILMEPDLGTALTIMMITFSLLTISDLPLYYLILLVSPILSIVMSFFSIPLFIGYILLLTFVLFKSRLSLLIIGLAGIFNTFIFFFTPMIWNSLKDYQQNRILSFIDPSRDPFGAGYQIIQSKIAIGSGRIMGKGFLLGTQKNLNFLPEHHTDFIFSVIGEETGFLGCIIVMFLFLLLFIRIAKIITKLKQKEFRYTATGILAFLSFQTFVNIGMTLGIVPTTGIPLPFISYGGSNLLINVTAISLILKFLSERSIFK
ncbi:MAG: rod shape-determining protein RodA [Candidatus Cloacimonetes bacterium]|nr:rod shape-determining protein RodA [Candidatus Cloacimonadota bacterium]